MVRRRQQDSNMRLNLYCRTDQPVQARSNGLGSCVSPSSISLVRLWRSAGAGAAGRAPGASSPRRAKPAGKPAVPVRASSPTKAILWGYLRTGPFFRATLLLLLGYHPPSRATHRLIALRGRTHAPPFSARSPYPRAPPKPGTPGAASRPAQQHAPDQQHGR